MNMTEQVSISSHILLLRTQADEEGGVPPPPPLTPATLQNPLRRNMGPLSCPLSRDLIYLFEASSQPGSQTNRGPGRRWSQHFSKEAAKTSQLLEILPLLLGVTYFRPGSQDIFVAMFLCYQ